MKTTANPLARALSAPTTAPHLPTNGPDQEDEFYGRLQHIWSKVQLLREVGFIGDDNDQYQYAYRLTEIELQKVCAENAALRESMQAAGAR